MAFIQKNTPPPNTILTFTLKDFSGGLNNSSDQLKDNESSSILNMEFADESILEKRKGQVHFDEFVTSTPSYYIDEFKPYQDENVLVRATDTHVYIENEVLTNVQGKISGINHDGKYIFADGNKLYVYGLFPQVTSTYVKITGTAVNDYVLLEIISPADGHTKLGTEHVKGVLNVDYTNFKVFYEPCENEFKDTYKGANVVPTNIRYLVSHNGRVFASGNDKDDDNVFITDVRNAFYFPVSLPIQMPPNSDKIVGMIVYDNSVVIGRQHDIHAIFGNTNRPDMGIEVFNLKRINTHTGFANNHSVDIAHNYLFFLGNDGNMYALGSTRTDDKQLSTTIISQQIDLKKTPINININDLSKANSTFFGDLWYVNIDDKTLIYSYRLRAWTMFKGLNSKCMYVLNNKLIWCNDKGRTVAFSDTEYLDFGAPYEAHWHSKMFDMNESSTYKQFREFYIVAHTYGDYNSDINILFEIDYSDVKDKVTIINQISSWGKSVWGDRLINRNINESLPFVIGKRGRNIRFKITNGHNLRGETATYSNLEYYIGREEGMVIKVLDENKYYLYTNNAWKLMNEDDLNQRMKFYQINGEYETRGKR